MAISSSSQLFQLPLIHPPSPSHHIPVTGYTLIPSKSQLITLRTTGDYLFPVISKSTVRFRRYCTKSTEEIPAETFTTDNDDDDDYREENHRRSDDVDKVVDGGSRRNTTSLSDALNLGLREPVYEVC